MKHFQQHTLHIHSFAMPVLDSRMYLISQPEKTEELLIIDPLESDEAIPLFKQYTKATILLTHSHYDHISGVNWLRTQLPCTLISSPVCAQKITHPDKNLAAFSYALVMDKTEEEQKQAAEIMDFHYRCEADRIVQTPFTFVFGDFKVHILPTPGHSDCSQCIELTTDIEALPSRIVFTGDSLVNGHDTITRLPSGSKKDYNAITKPYLMSLPKDTLIMPGHGDWGELLARENLSLL
ncbi:MAG: MBL fold metallo-hydrolase [Lachnospiraceae bacterium]|nr:MBL fold metallo-hydrolase [Lachnospiraceae bacterium]